MTGKHGSERTLQYAVVTCFLRQLNICLLLLLLLLLVVVVVVVVVVVLHLSFHSVAIVLTLVQTKQIGINIDKRNNTKTQYKQYKAQYIQVHMYYQNTHAVVKTPPHTLNHT